MTEEQRKWYLAGANDMEAGRLVRHGPLLVAESKPPPALTAEEAKALLGEVNEGHRRNPRLESCHVCAAAAKLSLIATGENG